MWTYTTLIVIIQTIGLHHSYARLGQIFEDFACRSTNVICGTNMIFVPIIRFNNSKNLFNSQKCIQRCSCITDEYEEKNGNCVEKIHDSDEQNTNCIRGNCTLMKEITDFDCLLEGLFCGTNKVFRTIAKYWENEYIGFKCLVRCECANGYHQKNNQCIKKSISSKEIHNSCENNACKIGETILDIGCNLTGNICAMHALFIPISQEEPYSSMVPRNCIQRCTCESIKYVDKLTHCEEKIEVAKQTEIHNFAEFCPKVYYNLGEEIADIGCRLAGQKCGTNMKFVPMETLKAAKNQSHTIGCILRCSCEENFEYIKQNEQCIRKWYCDGGFCQLKRKIYDYGCKLTGLECGINMKFVFIREVSDEICIQKCKCASEEFVEKNGKCEDKKKKPNISRHTSMQKFLKVGQILEDFGCLSINSECGSNMVFRPIVRFYNISFSLRQEKCFQRCNCKNNYDEINGLCIERINIDEHVEENEGNRRCFENEICKLGDRVNDEECQLTGVKCGANMVFIPTSIAMTNRCVQYCVCDNESMVADDKCIKRNALNLRHEDENQNITQEGMQKNHENIVLNCMRGKCKLMEEISDFGCTLKGRLCGRNMVFKTISNEINPKFKSKKCVVKCVCAVGFYEKNDRCIRLNNSSNMTEEKVRTFSERLFDADCILSGIECGINMIFITVQKFYPSSSCIQECHCKSGFEFDSKLSLCKKSANDVISINFFEHCPQPYEFGQEIVDYGCHLTGEKCGKNMVFTIAQKFTPLNNSVKCIQRCSCEDGYMEEFGECIKVWYCEGGYCKLGRKFFDYGCVFTSFTCGTNMKFITERKEEKTDICIQRCNFIISQ